MNRIFNYINGSLIPPSSGRYFPNFEPATAEAYSDIPDSDAQDIAAAVQAAEAAFPAWSQAGAKARSKVMLRIAALMEEYKDELAAIESRDSGKPLALATVMDIPRAIENIEFFATAILHTSSEAHQMDGTALNYTLRNPLGVVACISPWNLPLYLFTWKIAPALAAGNCVVAKPSELTPATAGRFSEICIEAGLPPGVLNIIHGYGAKAGAAVVEDPRIKAISFTGGTATGETIARTAAPKFKKLSLELGGKNPAVVFADCDYQETLAQVIRSAFTNQGEICLCGSRIFIEKPLYERFCNDFVERVKTLKVGDPDLDDTQQGALVSEGHMNKVLSYVELAKQEGATILCGGKRMFLSGRCANGWFVEPTVIEGLPNSCRTNQEEIFGPLVTLMPFETEEEVLSMANGTDYGLAASVWTSDMKRTMRMTEKLNFGIVWVNCWMLRDLRTPFGGMKQSGVGREGGFEALRFFTEAKNVCLKY
jgi:aminomuconate-semialdehyde/2-hydroxymuconate-6-semialdehyde dehydrogenase